MQMRTVIVCFDIKGSGLRDAYERSARLTSVNGGGGTYIGAAQGLVKRG